MFEKMVQSIQTDEARHAQIGGPVLKKVVEHDPDYAQYLVDKWFWRNWLFFAVVTGFAMDYLTPIDRRTQSFKEFVEEWVVDQFSSSLRQYGLRRPWYWETFTKSLDYFHHMVYASAYSYRATVWFDLALPGPEERDWLRAKYPASFPEVEPVWERLTERWKQSGPGLEWFTHGATPVGFCHLCQLVLSGGTPRENTAKVVEHEGQRYVFCSEPCAWIFGREPERYAGHKDVVKRILAGEAPANLLELLRKSFGLTQDMWGKDVARGAYPWLSPEGKQPKG
jgi:toluene monooxygenase system protein A